MKAKKHVGARFAEKGSGVVTIVVDTNVVVSGLRSRQGSSNLILNNMLCGATRFALSPALVLEYKDVLKRPGNPGSGYFSVERSN